MEAEDAGIHSCEVAEIAALADYVQAGVRYVDGIHSRLCALGLRSEPGPLHAVMVMTDLAFHLQSFFEIPVVSVVLCKFAVGTLMM